jgi:hypothetical protein
MPRKIKPRTFDETLSRLRSLNFDVREVPGDANQILTQQIKVSKYDCAAVLGRDPKGGVTLVEKPGILLGGEIAYLLDRGYQKFFKTSRLEIAATADRLKAEHRFAEELDEATGAISLYNESLGSVSDEYMYDRVKGRDKDGPAQGATPWDIATGVASSGH